MQQGAPQPQAQPAIPRRTLALIIAGLLTGLLLGALDQTIVATAGPTIIADLGGLSVYAWVFSLYILTQTVSMPIFGKLSDLYGRRKFLMLGLVIFMAGSALSGAAQDINQLIVFRAIQGIGSGAFFPIAIAVAGVVFPPSQRGRVQGIFSSVFGIAAVLGPSAGSYLVQAISWRWIFYVNLPLGVASILFISLGLRESRNVEAKTKVDWMGVATLTSWVTLLMLGFLSGGSTFSWYSWEEAVMFASSGVLFGVFIFVERRSSEPIVPLAMFRIRTVAAGAAVAFLTGVAMYAVISYVPLFVQAALAGGVDDARNVLYAFMIPLVLGAMTAGQLSTRSVSYRPILVVGLGVLSLGLYLFTSVTALTPITTLMEYGAVMGLGLGTTFPVIILAMQYSVSRRQIGIASSLAQFMRNLGGTIGLSVLGALQVNTFGAQLKSVLASVPSQYQAQAAALLNDPNQVGRLLSTPEALAQAEAGSPLLAQLVPQLQGAFALSVEPLFLAGFAVSIGAIVAGLFVTGSFRQQVAAREAMHIAEDAKLASESKPPMVEGNPEGAQTNPQ